MWWYIIGAIVLVIALVGYSLLCMAGRSEDEMDKENEDWEY